MTHETSRRRARRTHWAKAVAGVSGVGLLIALPLTASGEASLPGDVLTTTTLGALPDPLGSVVAPVEETLGATTTTTNPSKSTTTTTSPGEAPVPAPVGSGVSTGAQTGAESGGPSVASAEQGPASWVVESPDASTGVAAFQREMATQPFLDGPVSRSPGTRSTGPLFDRLAGLRLAPNQVARLLAPFPVAGRASYSDDWGLPRHGPGDLARTHKGVDVFADRSTPVIASVDGVVSGMTTAGVLGGTSLRLTAPDGTFFYYAHLDRFAPGVSEGDRVARGRVLGFVGNTGNAAGTGPHLHFEIHPEGGAAVPPVPYLDRWLAEAAQLIDTLAAAPVAARSSVLRGELDQRAARSDAANTADGSTAAGPGDLQTISAGRDVGIGGLLVVLAVAAWYTRRWARLRSRQTVAPEGWSILDSPTSLVAVRPWREPVG